MKTMDKDPNANKPVVFDWSEWLADNESISSFTTAVVGVTKGSESNDGRRVTVWVSGGSVGAAASVSCQITTNSGRVDRRKVAFTIKEM